MQFRSLLDEGLHRGLFPAHGLIGHAGGHFQRFQPASQFAVELSGNHGHRRKLLLAQQAFHILAQHSAGVERQ